MGYAEVISLSEVRASKQWDLLREQLHARFDQWLDRLHSMIKFFVLDVLLRQVVAVSNDPAPDSAFAPSFLGRPSGQLP